MPSLRKLYYRLVSRFANIDIPVDVSEFQLIDRVVVDALRQFDDYYPYIRGMIANCGFRTTGVEYTWKVRKRGLTKHRMHHLLDQGLNGVISFTKLPMRLCMILGVSLSVLSLSWSILSLVINLLFFRRVLPAGVQSLIVAVFFFAGLQLLFFGILGEYISAIHFQVRKRPLVVERERINLGPPARIPGWMELQANQVAAGEQTAGKNESAPEDSRTPPTLEEQQACSHQPVRHPQ
jgi:glycosyltransferase involved in cell wall biosynthesis